jgi:GNAT superfamily N-acetyltransferase
MLTIRLAHLEDIDEICAFDHVALAEEARREAIHQAVRGQECILAQNDRGKIVGYALMNYNFYANGFVELLYIHADHRRQGIGGALMQHLESTCRTPKLFTSTNLSNLPMQSLLARLGYRLSGVIHDLDEGDPELVYVKVLG